ncbi:MAG TPA: glutathione S-transferase N-terminal domain-containing protein [Polyangiaceae bacterium]|nr:glutathione S-transferase N-terminal domain-containing protein [Polyangiaceae bacterium]
MIKLYFHHTPNPMKVVLMLEETAQPYELLPIDLFAGQQHEPTYRAINPNGKVPAIIDDDRVVFDSNAILLYLAEKSGRFVGDAGDRAALLSWLFFAATGLGPFCGQAVHFTRIHQASAYTTNRYLREVERHFTVLDARLALSPYLAGATYTIADMAAYSWIDWADRNQLVLGDEAAWARWLHLHRWFLEIAGRPAAQRARSAGKDLPLKTAFDDETLRALFPQNYAVAG